MLKIQYLFFVVSRKTHLIFIKFKSNVNIF
nr:MAG TPA: hypothetical protein [Caudoviricetes sp.]